MKNCRNFRLFLLLLAALGFGNWGYAEPTDSKLGLFSPNEITLKQDSIDEREFGFVIPCGRFYVSGNMESETPTPSVLAGLLTEFCNDPLGFRLNKTYLVEYQVRSETAHQVINAAEVILWNDDGIYVMEHPWIARLLPVKSESLGCASIQVGPSPGLTDFDNEQCIRFSAEEFFSAITE